MSYWILEIYSKTEPLQGWYLLKQQEVLGCGTNWGIDATTQDGKSWTLSRIPFHPTDLFSYRMNDQWRGRDQVLALVRDALGKAYLYGEATTQEDGYGKVIPGGDPTVGPVV